MGRLHTRTICVAALLLALAGAARCQTIFGLGVPTYLCSGGSATLVFGQQPHSNIYYQVMKFSLGQSEQIFLPDGRPCDDSSCVYQSSVSFIDFPDTSKIRSVQDIKYVRLKIEHSYMADLYIGLKCPNGQRAALMRFGGAIDSECGEELPFQGGWLAGSNAYPGSFLGNAIDSENPYEPCNADHYANRPGTGWNYCWSNNSSSGYQYAFDDAIIYRSSNITNYRVDSSNVAAHTNFYHPDQSFNSLRGCPLNGDWSIEVIDGMKIDNGYLFGWEIVLDSSLIPRWCNVDSFAIIGPGVERVNDSTFTITTPPLLTRDTTVEYRFLIYNSCGDIIDTSAYITLKAPISTYVYEEILENDLPFNYYGVDFYDDVTYRRFNLLSTLACDSIVYFSLNVWHNQHTRIDTLVCSTQLPVTWRGREFHDADTARIVMHDIHGADSILDLYLHVQQQDTIDYHAAICNGRSYTWLDGVTYTDTTENPLYVMPGRLRCDSVLRLHLYLASSNIQAVMSIYPNPVTFSDNLVTLNDMSGSRRRIWHFLGQTDTLCHTTFNFPTKEDTVNIELIVFDDIGCTDSTTGVVSRDKTALWVPNAFTPNKATNGLFRVFTNGIYQGEVFVYDRRGLLITSFDILTGSWDGTCKGRDCPEANYVWIARYSTVIEPAIFKEEKGSVLLLR